MLGRVTIGVPVFRGEAFLEESLNSILNQTYEAFDVIISMDEPNPACEEICSQFLKDSRFRMVMQQQRLGWMGNMNWLMSQVETEFWHLQEQDDVIERDFLALLVAYARANPAVATIYPDIRIFGNDSFPIVQKSVVGSVYARQMALLSEHLSAVALIGLSRVEALRAAGGIPENECENFFAETAWMAAIARWGELHRVPGELFHKRIHDENTVTSWFRWPREKRLSAWCVHCLSMLEESFRIEATLEERRSLWRAGVERLVSSRTAGMIIEVAELTLAERKSMLDNFLHRARALTTIDLPAVLDADWNEIDSFTKDFYGIVSIRALGN